jgi:hypothetical protein
MLVCVSPHACVCVCCPVQDVVLVSYATLLQEPIPEPGAAPPTRGLYALPWRRVVLDEVRATHTLIDTQTPGRAAAAVGGLRAAQHHRHAQGRVAGLFPLVDGWAVSIGGPLRPCVQMHL